ncbi:MAG TPA: SulP family inorganic anion transporter [Saprospiraceae bacterium]|nr:SulP family inorganic anion transporter [Saprospiraceae bacterium]
MSANEKEGLFANLKYDLPASIVVFLVALPLCLGIALASGAPLFSGIISGIVGGTIVALLSGSPLGVSGPAAGLAVIVLTAIQELGSFDVFLMAVVIAGAIQLIFGLLKAGVIGYYFPSSVIKGMLAGIGIIIFLKQIPHALGYDKDPEGDFAFMQVDGQNTFSELINMLNYISPGAVIIATLSILILILWERPFMKKLGFTNIIQGPLVVVVLGILLNSFFTGTDMALRGDQTVNIPVAESISGFFGQFSFPDFSQWNNSHVYVTAMTIAIVASLETLLCVEATDKLDPRKRITPTNRELVAQGVGNMVAGFIGGLPVTQVIVRSSANIQSGGRSKASAFIHGIMLLVSAMAIPSLLNKIPLASLAAILFLVGYKLAKPSLFRTMYKMGKTQFIPFIVTIVGIVFTDLLIGIGMGMAVAIVQLLWNNYKVPYHFDPKDYKEGEPIFIKLAEDVSFLNKASIQKTLEEIPENSHVIIDASKAKTIHPDILEIFADFEEKTIERNIRAEIRGLDENEAKIVDPLGLFRDVVVPEGKNGNNKSYLKKVMTE